MDTREADFILDQMRIERFMDIHNPDQEKIRIEHNAIKFAQDAIAKVAEYEEMLEAAHTLKFDKGTYIVRLGKEPYEYGIYVDGIIGDGDYSSWFEAFKAIKEQK